MVHSIIKRLEMGEEIFMKDICYKVEYTLYKNETLAIKNKTIDSLVSENMEDIKGEVIEMLSKEHEVSTDNIRLHAIYTSKCIWKEIY